VPRRHYLNRPTADPPREKPVPLAQLTSIAELHLRELGGGPVALGEPLPLADREGRLLAYVFPFIRGTIRFPATEQIFDLVAEHVEMHNGGLPFHHRLRCALGGEPGSLYLSATRATPPVLGVTPLLHPYFLVGEKARDVADHAIDARTLRRIYFLGPDEEYFEFGIGERSVLVHGGQLQPVQPREVLSRQTDIIPAGSRSLWAGDWARLTEAAPNGIRPDAVGALHLPKEIHYQPLIPVVPWTWWCVPTAVTMVVGFWDSYVPGTGTVVGYGRLLDHWLDHSSGNNVPDFIDQLIDPVTGTWRKAPGGGGYTNLADFIKKRYGYSFLYLETTATSANDYAWSQLTAEIDAGRPLVWSTWNHSNAAFGYRTTSAGRMVITYSTWGATATAQRKEWSYTLCEGIGRLVPNGMPPQEHLVLGAPRGGEQLSKGSKTTIKWYVWGSKITTVDIDYSLDGGKTWSTVVKSLPVKTGWGYYSWQPPATTKKGRARVRGYSATKQYIAGDGSPQRFTVGP
jgi:hypothetical protein